jgi:orotidine 5'-phosphate decarboxylase subfamily 1
MNQLHEKSEISLKVANFNNTKKSLGLLQRAALCTNKTAQTLFRIMHDKKTNLAIAADVTKKKELLELADKLGPYICILKTHIDIIDDFDWDLIEQLQKLAREHNFLIFEDRKFADIGNTVKMQYAGGIYKIAQWAHIVNAHTVPGPGIIEGLKQASLHGAGLILLPQMSSAGNLASGDYTIKSIAMADAHPDFVIGFIAREPLSSDPRFINFTPGVQLQEGGDGLGQQYLTPEQAIAGGSDVIIVGRGIIKADDPIQAAQQYREQAWRAYQQ